MDTINYQMKLLIQSRSKMLLFKPIQSSIQNQFKNNIQSGTLKNSMGPYYYEIGNLRFEKVIDN